MEIADRVLPKEIALATAEYLLNVGRLNHMEEYNWFCKNYTGTFYEITVKYEAAGKGCRIVPVTKAFSDYREIPGIDPESNYTDFRLYFAEPLTEDFSMGYTVILDGNRGKMMHEERTSVKKQEKLRFGFGWKKTDGEWIAMKRGNYVIEVYAPNDDNTLLATITYTLPKT